MSFGFTVEKESWGADGGDDIRTLEQVKLYDVSPVTFPAYTETDCGLRSYEAHKKEQAKREAELAKQKAEFERLKAKFTNKN
jgi:HK97 family phage prohead protease